jgi:hypothetical protein
MQHMNVNKYDLENGTAVEIISDEVLITSEQDALDLMADVGYQYESTKIILHKKHVSEHFFELKTGLAGAVLQKFSNYRVRLAIIGEFSNHKRRSLKDFIYESNRNGHILFVEDIGAALEALK